MKEEYLIQACTGKRVDVFKGQTITVIDVSGGQVADFFAESPGQRGGVLIHWGYNGLQ